MATKLHKVCSLCGGPLTQVLRGPSNRNYCCSECKGIFRNDTKIIAWLFQNGLVNISIDEMKNRYQKSFSTGAYKYTSEKKCMLCGQQHNGLGDCCGRCLFVMREQTAKLLSQAKKGTDVSEHAANVYRRCYMELPPDAQAMVPPNINDIWDDPETDLRFHDANRIERINIIKKLDQQRKENEAKALAAKPTKCCRCWAESSELDEWDVCPRCRDLEKPPDERWFKGVVGLQNMTLERIALLPSFARSYYTKHMNEEEIKELNDIVLANKPKPKVFDVLTAGEP
jgi:hypothetical protein